MLLQDAVTCAQSQAVFRIGLGIDLKIRTGGRWREGHGFGGDYKYGRSCPQFGADGQDPASTFAEHVQAVGDQLQADLQQLIGIPQDFGQSGIELRTDFDLKSLPLGLGQLDGGARQGIEIDETLGRGRLPGKTDETGNQRLGAANILADLGGEGQLLPV